VTDFRVNITDEGSPGRRRPAANIPH